MKRVLLLIHSKSRQGAALSAEAFQQLRARGFEVERPRGDLEVDFSTVIKERAAELDLVVVGGGDGSIRNALDGVIETKLPLGVLPLGTANNFARNLGIPLTLNEACDVLAARQTRQVDVADVNGIYFANVAGIGLSTLINDTIPSDLKKRWGWVAYAVYSLKVLRSINPFRADIIVNGRTLKTKTLQITVCNGRHYGSGLIIKEDATIDDQALDLLSVEVDGWWKGLPIIPSLIRGRYEWASGVRLLREQAWEIHTKKPLRVDTDGDLTTKTPARFRVHPRALKVVAPPVSDSNATRP